MLISDNELVEIEIKYRQIGKSGKRYEAFTLNEFKEAVKEEVSNNAKRIADSRETKVTSDVINTEAKACKGKFEALFTSFKVKMVEQTWGLHNELQELGMVDVGEGDRRFSFKKYKETKMKKLLKEWSLVDKENKPVPVTEANIMHLPPQVGEAIIRAYDEVSFVSDDDEKK